MNVLVSVFLGVFMFNGMIANEEEYSDLSQEEEKVLDIEVFKILKRNTDYYDPNSSEGQEIESYLDSLEATNAGKIYRFEEKVIEKDTLGAFSVIDGVIPSTDIEQNFKIVNDIYWRSWFIGIYSFTPQDSLVLNEIAYLSPRVAGNAVYTARVLLGLMIIDTETYAAKSAQTSVGLKYSKLKIYPNPSNFYFMYELPLKEEDKGEVVIHDVSGKEILKWSVDYSTRNCSIDVQSYSKGVYFFELTINGTQKFVEKLIVK